MLPLRLISVKTTREGKIGLSESMRDALNVTLGQNLILKIKDNKYPLMVVNTTRDMEGVGFIHPSYNLSDGYSIINEEDLMTIGADPEFVLEDEGYYVYAASISNNGRADYNKYTDLGCDGPCAELRPEFSPYQEHVVKSIQSIMDRYSEHALLHKFKWVGGTFVSGNVKDLRYGTTTNRVITMGGHIHIGYPKTFRNFLSKNNYYSCGNKSLRDFTMAKLTMILDHHIGELMVKFECDHNVVRRSTTQHGKYGFVGDCRYQPHGFEWRTLSGAWLLDKKLTRSIFGLVKSVMAYVIKNIFPNKKISIDTFIENLNQMVPNQQQIQETINIIESNRTPNISYLKNKLRILDTKFGCNHTDIGTLEELLHVDESDWECRCSKDLRKIWLT